MSDARQFSLPRSSSEPDFNVVPDLYGEILTDVDFQFGPTVPASTHDSNEPPADQPPLSLNLTALTLPSNEEPSMFPTTSVSFTEYVAHELARSTAVSGIEAELPETSSDGLSRFLGPNEAELVRASPPPSTQPPGIPNLSSSPRIPRSPRTPLALRIRKPASSPSPKADTPKSEQTTSTIGSTPTQSYGIGARQSKLPCIEVDESGAVRRRLLSRTEILKEARETLHKSHPSPSAAAAWMRRLDEGHVAGDASIQEMDSFASLMDAPVGSNCLGGGAKGDNPKKALREYLRKYLRNSLQPRDIRQVDPAFAAKPALWIRHTALVVSMEGLRAIVFRTKVLIFESDPKRTNQAVDTARQMIMVKPDMNSLQPFEFKALEAILIHVLTGLERIFFDLKPEIQRSLKEMPKELNTKKLEDLRLQKQKLNQFRSRAAIVQDILEKVLDEDEDMANMYLTEKHTNPKRARNVVDHDEVEMLLEAYLQVADELVNQSSLLNDQIENTEDLVMIHLDTLRNRLLSVELLLSVVSMTFGVGSVISGIFGMNLPIAQFDEGASPYWFLSVVIVIFVMCIGVSWLILYVLRMRGLYSFHGR